MAAYEGSMSGGVASGGAFEHTGVVSDCHSRVEFHLQATGLRNMDTFSNSDAFCVVYIEGRELGRTSVQYDTQNPNWHKQFQADYFFEEVQTVRVVVYDEDKKGSSNLKHHDMQGEATFALADLMTSHGSAISIPLTKKGRSTGHGTLIVRGEEMASCSEMLQFQLSGKKLVNKDGWGILDKSDPFFVIKRSREDGQWVRVYKSVKIMDNLNPTWPLDMVSVQSICNGDMDRTLMIEVWDWDKSGDHDFMGSTETCVRDIMNQAEMPLFEKDKKGRNKPAGRLLVKRASLFHKPSFLDYIQGGWELNMVVAVDFTGSNGNPAEPGTLHYVDRASGIPNPYQATIRHLSSVLEQYDSDQLLPCYGFGGRGGADRRVNHCFPLNGNQANPYVHGHQGVLEAYEYALTQWGLSGPTNFSPVIKTAAAMAQRKMSTGALCYTILLIITDGEITDKQATVNAIVAASNLPMSIVIVGVGNSTFTNMEELDGDDAVLIASSGQRASRDIVQFVKFNDYRNAGPGRLGKETLAELPGQMMDFFTKGKIRPPAKVSSAAEVGAAQVHVVDSETERLAAVGKKMLQNM